MNPEEPLRQTGAIDATFAADTQGFQGEEPLRQTATDQAGTEQLDAPPAKKIRVRPYKYVPRPKRPGVRKRSDRRRTREQVGALKERVVILAQLHPGIRPKEVAKMIGPSISPAWVVKILKEARRQGIPGVLRARAGRDRNIEQAVEAKVKERAARQPKPRPLTPGEEALAALLGGLPYRPTKANTPDV
jgi:transposase